MSRFLWRGCFALALALLLGLSLMGVWGGWQVHQAEAVLNDLVDGRRLSAETQLEARAERLGLVGRWWPRAEWQRALLLEWSAQPLAGEAQRRRLEEAEAVLSAAIERLPAEAFTARDQLRLALKLGRPDSEIEAVLKRIERRAPNNFELHRDALSLLLPAIEQRAVPVQIWAMTQVHRVAQDARMSHALLERLSHREAVITACSWAGVQSAMGRICRGG